MKENEHSKLSQITPFTKNNSSGRDSPYRDSASSLSRFHDYTQTHHTRYDSSGQVISTTQRPLPDNVEHPQASIPPAGFEPAIPASESPQTHAFGRAATGIGRNKLLGRPNQRQCDGGEGG